jgi:hypothetical protein
MSLTDVMSGAGLVEWAEVGLVVSFVAFAGIVLWTWTRPKAEMDTRSRVVLDDEPASALPSETQRPSPSPGQQG